MKSFSITICTDNSKDSFNYNHAKNFHILNNIKRSKIKDYIETSSREKSLNYMLF